MKIHAELKQNLRNQELLNQQEMCRCVEEFNAFLNESDFSLKQDISIKIGRTPKRKLGEQYSIPTENILQWQATKNEDGSISIVISDERTKNSEFTVGYYTMWAIFSVVFDVPVLNISHRYSYFTVNREERDIAGNVATMLVESKKYRTDPDFEKSRLWEFTCKKVEYIVA